MSHDGMAKKLLFGHSTPQAPHFTWMDMDTAMCDMGSLHHTLQTPLVRIIELF